MSDHYTISKVALVSLLGEFLNGNPNPEDPQPPGPWDPVIRQTLEQMRHRLGPHPEPWRGKSPFGRLDSLDWVLLNPQPLPPRIGYATTLAQRAIIIVGGMPELMDAMPSEMQGILLEFAIARLHSFVDDCGNGRIPGWPFPWPPRSDTSFDPLSPVEMMVIGVTLLDASQTIANEAFRVAVLDAGDRMMEMAAERMM